MRPFHLITDLVSRCKDFPPLSPLDSEMPWRETRIVIVNRKNGPQWEISFRYISEYYNHDRLREVFNQWAEVHGCEYSEIDRFGNRYFYFMVKP